MFIRFFLIILILSAFQQCRRTYPEKQIDLRSQNLTRIPDSVFTTKNVVTLNLGVAEFTLYAPLSGLGVSSFNPNRLNNLGAEVCKLKSLRELVVNFNQLTSLPDCITELSNLEFLDISFNSKFRILQEIDKLNKLPKLKKIEAVYIDEVFENEQKIRKALRPGIILVTSLTDYKGSK